VAAVIDVVVIPVLNRYDLLERAIESLDEIETLIVIDNGDGLPDHYLDTIQMRMIAKRRYLWKMPSNLGVASSWNLGIKATPHASGWLLLNSDACFGEDAFSIFSQDTKSGDVVQAGAPPWCCTWISANAIRRVGLFCERFHPAYMEDVDWERRARILGITFVQSAAVVHHDNSSTIASDPVKAERNRETHAQNHALYEYRWSRSGGNVPADMEWSLATRLQQAW
jgi:GT2 family glycosyltransferase